MRKVEVKSHVTSEAVAEPRDELWSNCLKVGNVVYISGLTSRAPDNLSILGNDAYAQSKVIFSKMRSLLEAAGGTIDDIVKLTIYVTDISTNTLVWKARREFFSGHFPTSTLVEVSALALPQICVEIDGIAYIGCSRNDAKAS
jgi:enamine deaminase RidA (YjgF/YER057c/UK114 family)